ncbi:hemopexin repeat-containing protein [Nonomuraea antimicrobica]|uniref:Tc toxin subunit A-related protein n=1 Tax=Nonomuraea antimicrobica TaxID=561173 RepID=UPI0031EFCDC6
MPSYELLFGDLDLRAGDEARSVYSPAAYLVDLLNLLRGSFDETAVQRRRPDLGGIPLDEEHTFTPTPYLDIVNEVLETLVGPNPYAKLRDLQHPFALPFSFTDARVRVHLRHLGIDPAEFYRLFASRLDRDRVAREYLGLSTDDVDAVTVVRTDEAGVAERYGRPSSELSDVEAFLAATSMTGAELGELLESGYNEGIVSVAPDDRTLRQVSLGWLDRVNRFVRLSRRTGLPITELDVVVSSCCSGVIDLRTLSILAAAVHLHRTYDLAYDVIAGLTSRTLPDTVDDVPVPPGDLLAPQNRDYRLHLARSIDLAEADIVTVVQRFRDRYATPAEAGPFDRGIGTAALSLLHRVARLVSALGVSVEELFTLLSALEADPALRRHSTFPVLPVLEPSTTDCYRILEGTNAPSSLWLTQTLLALTAWMRDHGFGARDLAEILGEPATPESEEEQQAVLAAIKDRFETVALDAGRFVSDRFDERAARVVHGTLTAYADGVVSPRDPRLLRIDPDVMPLAAYDAVTGLAVLTGADFHGLGLADRLITKIFTNLVLSGVLQPDGRLTSEDLPARPILAGDYEELAHDLFTAIASLDGAFYPSDLAGRFPELTASEHEELYDNLVHNGYLDETGQVVDPGLFTDPASAVPFTASADLGDVAEGVFAALTARIDRFRRATITLDPGVFAAFRLTETQSAALVESLRFNGVIDAHDAYVDKALPDDLGLMLEFYPIRRAVLEAMRGQIAAVRTELYTFTPDDFAPVAEQAIGRRVADRLDGGITEEGRVREAARALFDDPAGAVDLGPGFTAADGALVHQRIAAILAAGRPYRLDLDAVAELGFDGDERSQLVELLVQAGHLDVALGVPWDRLAYFGTVTNALDFTLPGAEDYSRDVFFLLHPVATAIMAAVDEVAGQLDELAVAQYEALPAVLQDAFGVAAPVIEAISAAVTPDASDVLVTPALAGDSSDITVDPHFLRTYRRIRRFARLAAKLGLDATEVAVAFHDQDLAGKFPEPLALPPGIDRFDALLTGGDGRIYLFKATDYWIYSAATHALTDPRPKPLSELSAHFTALAGVDAAFVRPDGVEWIVGRGVDGLSHAFTRDPGGSRWAPKDQVWGKVRNNFTDPKRIDNVFADGDGRTYVFSGDQYVRYSTDDYTHADEGYPRSIGEWWEGEGRDTPLPEAFRFAVDAAFRGHDGRTHVFSGDRWFDGVTEAPLAERWGRVRNTFAAAERIDAAYADGEGCLLFAGNQVVRYTDSLENEGVRVADGYPRRIESWRADVPAEFEGAVEAAFQDGTGTVHLFRDGRTVALGRTGAGPVTPTVERWGLMRPVLRDGRVDAAFVGLDGKTYLFSGDRYVRYSTADYSLADLGYPRAVAGDWGGLDRVDAAFVMDGATHLFGPVGQILDLPADYEAELASGRLSPALRRRLQEHHVTLPDDARVTGAAPEWSVAAEGGIRLTIRRAGERIKVYGDDTTFYVRYSTRDYTVPDAGYPRPLADNWWNLPVTLAADPGFARVDAVFTGQDNQTYLFSGDRFVVFDARHRWWSEPRTLRERWDSLLPFDHVDAAFVGKDGRTYVFSDDLYVRYSTADLSQVDDRFPAGVSGFWGKVVNNVARTGRVDATLVLDAVEQVDGVEVTRTYTYLFSGDQYVRYRDHDYSAVQDGYPRAISALSEEPRLANLGVRLSGVDAAFADRRNVHLFRDGEWHVVSDTVYRKYDDLHLTGLSCAFVDHGAVFVEREGEWRRHAALEGPESSVPTRPLTLRTVPAEYRTGLDAVLTGRDGTTYLFKGATCHNTAVNRDYPLAEEWGRPRNTIYQDNAVDAAFVGRDGRTYLFRGDQFVVYGESLDTIEGDPRPIAAHWGGLTSVALAYVRHGVTHLFEHPDETGAMRHVVYTGERGPYGEPDEGYPASADESFWKVPDLFPTPQAVLFENDTMLLLAGERYVPFNDESGQWSYPRPIERIWRGFGRGVEPGDTLRAAFTAADGSTYFFFTEHYTRYADRAFSPLRPIRERWGKTANPFVPDEGGSVDAAIVFGDDATFLFSGAQYVRYTGAEYRYVDPGYPKAVAVNLRAEPEFAGLPESFEDAVAGRRIDAAVANGRSAYLVVGGALHVVSRAPAATYEIGLLGRVRNTIAERQRVDAALVREQETFLFCGDQYVRYTGGDYEYADDGYPRTIAGSLERELELRSLPAEFEDGVDAAFRAHDRRVYLFKGTRFLVDGVVRPVAERWGKVLNQFAASPVIDAAFVAPGGELYAFRGEQYVRYSAALDVVDEGFPRTIRDDWGNLPESLETGITGACVLKDVTYLIKNDQYMRYQGRYDEPDWTFAQPIRHRWSDTADYRLTDVHTITRFAELAHARPGLAELLGMGAADPYERLAGLFGWDADELRWLKRNAGLITELPVEEERFEIEFVLKLVEVFALADRAGTGPSRLYLDVWTKPDPAAALALLLRRKVGEQEWEAVSRTVRNELNVLRRDALVPAALHLHPDIDGVRALYERLLVDVEMGAEGDTSRVREAIAAVQLYVHRYLLDLEKVLPDDEELRRRVKVWWSWLKNYRIWEANRKVFLYPENYLRPELRDTKTPAFRELENDLLQGEITTENVQRAYKRYLDEYTEVSRLSIAGAYVYREDGAEEGVRRLVLFGRTRTEPRRYYYRAAEFRDGERLSATWEPWLKVDAQIDSDRVDPVHAFGRVFVFWPVVETVAPETSGTTTIVTRRDGDKQNVEPPPPTYRVRISYSFCNLNQEWVTPQELPPGPPVNLPISDVRLSVQASAVLPGGDPGEHDSIVVSCSYHVTVPDLPGRPPRKVPLSMAYALTPELYAVPVATPAEPVRLVELSKIFAEPGAIDPASVVQVNSAAGSQDGPWFSVDHKGGSFLCRPMIPDPKGDPRPGEVAGNGDRLPAWTAIHAGFELGDTRYFFTQDEYLPVKQVGKLRVTNDKIVDRWGFARSPLTESGTVDAMLVRGDRTYVFSGADYYCYEGAPFGLMAPGYPKPIATNDDTLPRWSRIDAAYTAADVEYFYSTEHGFTSSNVLKGTAASWSPGIDLSWLSPPKDNKDKDRDRQPLPKVPQLDALLLRKDGRDRNVLFVIAGKRYARYTDGAEQPDEAPKPLSDSGNDNLPRSGNVHAAYRHGDLSYFFDNTAHTYVVHGNKGQIGAGHQTSGLGRVPTLIPRSGRVDAAYLDGDHLYLTSGEEYVRYTIKDGAVPDLIDPGYPKALPTRVRAVFPRGERHYVFGDRVYAVLQDGQELADLRREEFHGIEGSWRSLPPGFLDVFTGAMDTADKLFLFLGSEYIAYPKGATLLRPYEFAALPHEIIRLTSSTAFELNRRLLVGGVPGLLAPETQETDELPAFSTTGSGPTTIKVTSDVAGTPASSHLDFQSANGRYYWEIFFHAPLLIAQALNAAQRFEDARRWYEYVFDPTEETYWRFLPFLAVDLRALVDGCLADLDALKPADVETPLREILGRVADLIPAFEQAREATQDELTWLTSLATGKLPPILDGLSGLSGDTARSLRERVGLLARLRRQYELMGDHRALLKAYRDDPFDPHAIAELRPSAYRRAVVMAYVDNLLDWGDLLFGQHTMESVDEARMLYILAYDLLGRRPEGVGTRTLDPARTYDQLRALEPAREADPYAERLTAGGTLLDGLGVVHKSVADTYFFIPGNTNLGDYWTRVEDRLRKIRASLDLMGVSRPLPLFEPPVDVMALVRGAAAGLSPDQSAARPAARVPHQRFAATFRKAQELVDRLRQFGGDLLAALEKRDGEELTLLQSRQESTILSMTRAIKEAQVKAATEGLREAESSLAAAIERRDWYDHLISSGLSPLQLAQITMMSGAVAAHFYSGGLKIASAIAYAVPETYLGPFILGTEYGGQHLGQVIDKGAETAETLGEALSVMGELLGVRAEQERQMEEWRLQSMTARSDIVQLGHQVAGAGFQLAIARRELELTNQEIAHAEAVVTFLTGKFTSAELYQWMSARLAALYFQSYHLALETAKAAERAYQYERGVDETILQPVYWESRRKGLLAGETLAVDLDRLGKAYLDGDARGLEIVKRVSLLQLDPLAVLKLKSTGRCEFALTEALFDRDFPGHYRRRIRTLSVTFVGGEDQIGINATLTQLGHKTVLSADPRAVRFLLEAKGSPPDSVRSDWRPGQQIALSDPEPGRDNNGLFELRFDDDRYLPFEGTGAVSTWRLETNGPPPAELFDVVVTVKYAAEQGGAVFANAVKGMLKPYPAGRYIDVAGEFPEQWRQFQEGEDGVLALPLVPEMFPRMNGRQVTGIYATYEADRPGAARLLLNGDRRLALEQGTVVRTPGLSVGVTPLTLVADGDRTALVNVGLILTYRAV